MEIIINKIIENKIRLLLEIIHKNYNTKFKKENITKELEYIIKHVNIIIKEPELLEEQALATQPIPKKKSRHIQDEFRCCGRSWNSDIFDRHTMTKIKEIDTMFKVIDFNDININKFNKKYILGIQCKKPKYKNNDYCKLHSHHLIHGNYKEMPTKEICYHFMKDGKYL